MNDHKNTQSNKSAFERAADWFAFSMAVTGTFYAAPQVIRGSQGAFLAYAEQEFGVGWDGLLSPLFGIIAVIATFSVLTMLLAISLRLGLAKLSQLIFSK